jgi:hypothetical protein
MPTVKEMQQTIESQSELITRLQAEIEALRESPDEVDVPASAVDQDFALPSSRQLQGLWSAVCRRLPGVAREPTVGYEGFALTLWAIGASGIFEVIPDINRKYYATHFLDLIQPWLVSRGRSVSGSVHNITLSCAALHVPYMLTDPPRGVVAGYGLIEGHRSPRLDAGHVIDPGSRPVRNLWLKTLQGGALEPTAPPKLPEQPARLIESNLVRHFDDRPLLTY